MPNTRMTDARWACLAVERLREKNAPIDRILKEAGLSRRLVSDPDARIPYHKGAALLTLAAEATGDDCFGVHLSASIAPKHAGLLGYVLLNSATLGDALVNLVRYHRVLTDGLELDLQVGKEEAVLFHRVIDPLVVHQRQIVELGLSAMYHIFQLITDSDIRLSRVDFQHTESGEAQTVRDILGAPVRYRQEKNALVFEARFLDCPIEAADNELLKILKRYCQLILGAHPESDNLGYEVRHLIATMLTSGQPKIDVVAQELGMSSRTLTRRLAEDGLTFKGLLEEVRRKLALQYLNDRRISVKQAAYLLGYSEVSAFYHAFRRWVGSSPVEYRLRS